MILLIMQKVSQASPRAPRGEFESPDIAVLESGSVIPPWGEVTKVTITTMSIRTKHSMQTGIWFLPRRTNCSRIGETSIILFQKRWALYHRVPWMDLQRGLL